MEHPFLPVVASDGHSAGLNANGSPVLYQMDCVELVTDVISGCLAEESATMVGHCDFGVDSREISGNCSVLSVYRESVTFFTEMAIFVLPPFQVYQIRKLKMS